MTAEPMTDGTEIQIQACGTFADDAGFAPARQTLTKPSTTHLVLRENNETMVPQAADFLKVVTQMDSVFFSNDNFQLIVDMRGFPPQQIRCTVTADLVEIFAQQDDNEYIGPCNTEKSRSMNRRYQLPQKINPQQTTCCLSSEGILFVTAQWMKY